MDASVTKPAPHVGNIQDALAQITGELIWLWWVAIAVSAEPHKTASVALGKLMVLDHLANRLAFDLWG
jgi:hypothetical protein